MYRHILVPLDGSTFAEHALPYAVLIARDTGARLQLVLVHSSYSVATMETSIHATVEHWQTEQRQREADYLHEVAARIEAEAGLKAEPILLIGIVPAALAEFTKKSGADMVVMTTHGRSGLERAWLGSVADSLVRHVDVPVLVVRPNDQEPQLKETRPVFRHVVVALDGSALAEHVIDAVSELAQPATRYTLLRVVPPARSPISSYLPHAVELNRQIAAERDEQARSYLEQVGTRVRATHSACDWEVLHDDHPAQAIVRWAVANGADGIALSTHRRTPALRLLLGSVADEVVRGGTVPVLVG